MVIIPTVTGTNQSHTCHSAKPVRKLIKAQGPRGVVPLQILDDVEKYGEAPYDNTKLEALTAQCPRAQEYNIAIQIVLENYTSDIAEGMIRHGVRNGFDAWRRLFHHYVHLAEDLHHILIHELYDLKLVNEQDVDKYFNEIQRISEWYIRSGSAAMAEKWLVAAVKRNLPIKISIDPSMELRKLTIADEIRDAVNICRHDHRTGLPRGVPGTMPATADKAPGQELPIKITQDCSNSSSREALLPKLLTLPTPKAMNQTNYMQRVKVGRVNVAKAMDNAGNVGRGGGIQGASVPSLLGGKVGGDVGALKGAGKKDQGAKGKEARGTRASGTESAKAIRIIIITITTIDHLVKLLVKD